MNIMKDLLRSVWSRKAVVSFKPKWEIKTVHELKFKTSTGRYMDGASRSNPIIRSDDGSIRRTNVVHKIVMHLDPSYAVRIRINLRRLEERLSRLRKINSWHCLVTDAI